MSLENRIPTAADPRRRRVGWWIFALCAANWLVTALTAAQQHPAGPHRHPEAQALKNPVPRDPSSVTAGKQLYVRYCLGCHGPTGKGDGSMALGVIPPGLVDPTLGHGSSDGEIFAMIRDGGRDMDAYRGTVSEQQIWQIVNYIQTLRPKLALGR